jgi:hypothetical protein
MVWRILLVHVLLGLVSSHAAGRSDRPNILVILTDDQRWDALGVMQRNRWPMVLRIPDRLPILSQSEVV